MQLKEGVSIDGIQPEILVGVLITKFVFLEHQLEFTITSVKDGKHMLTSKHNIGQGVDIRSKHIPKALLPILLNKLRERLGRNFDLVLESDHLHLEYDPKLT